MLQADRAEKVDEKNEVIHVVFNVLFLRYDP